jgi:hypothetical protein
MGRERQFSYDALGLLYNHIDEADEAYALDVIAICCEYSEDSEEAIVAAYGLHEDTDVVDYLSEHTQVVGVTDSGTIVYAQF